MPHFCLPAPLPAPGVMAVHRGCRRARCLCCSGVRAAPFWGCRPHLTDEEIEARGGHYSQHHAAGRRQSQAGPGDKGPWPCGLTAQCRGWRSLGSSSHAPSPAPLAASNACIFWLLVTGAQCFDLGHWDISRGSRGVLRPVLSPVPPAPLGSSPTWERWEPGIKAHGCTSWLWP